MKKIFLKSYAKINLYLDVLGKRKDGYHNIKTIMQNINLFDELDIRVKSSRTRKIDVMFDNISLPQKENTIYRSAFLFIDELCENFDIKISVKKNIPPGSGLGGASSNAAATLVGLNYLTGEQLSSIQLCEIAKKIGSDVPFFLIGGTCICTGRGDKVRKLSFAGSYPVIVVYPNILISTKWAYQNLDVSRKIKRKSIKKILYGLKNNDLSYISSGLFNVFENLVVKHYPVINDIKQDILNLGASGALLTGSGSSIFGIFNNKDAIKLPNRPNMKVFISNFVWRGFDIL